jgi:glycosyltransferase involved in cell wall biosynthesis
MRIVHVMAWYIPGMGYQENTLPLEQARLGHDVEIITSDRIPDYPGFDRLLGGIFRSRILGAGTCEQDGIRIHRLPCLESAGQVYLVGLRSKLKVIGPDIVQSHGAFSPSTIQTILYSKRLGYRLFIDDHSHKTNYHAEGLVRRSYVSILRVIYRITDESIECFMPVTDSAREILMSELKIPTKKIELFPLGADTRRFKKLAQLRESGRSKYGIADETVVIVSAGKFTESKDVDVLIKAFGQIVKRNQNAMLLLVGNGAERYMSRLKEIADGVVPREKVRFIDFVRNADLPIIYNSSDIGVWPGDPSITVLEALATGLPTVVPKNELAYGRILAENAAIGFTRGDVDSLAEGIEALVESPRLMNDIANNARRLTNDSLSWRQLAEKSTSLYLS